MTICFLFLILSIIFQYFVLRVQLFQMISKHSETHPIGRMWTFSFHELFAYHELGKWSQFLFSMRKFTVSAPATFSYAPVCTDTGLPQHVGWLTGQRLILSKRLLQKHKISRLDMWYEHSQTQVSVQKVDLQSFIMPIDRYSHVYGL